ncbi:MAG: hypothetical protein V7750_19800, partial [Sneathiella sp.]
MRKETSVNSRHTYARHRPRTLPVKVLLMASVGVCVLSTSVSANEWTIDPYVGMSEQFSDNVLGTTSNEKSDFITSLETGFTITGETLRTDLSISYDL